MVFLETERMNLRQFRSDDFQNLFRLDSHPEVMKHISNGIPSTEQRVQEVLNNIISKYAEWKKFGFWAAE